MEPQKSPYIRDVKLPGVDGGAKPDDSSPEEKTQLVSNIPVAMQDGGSAPAPPPAEPGQKPAGEVKKPPTGSAELKYGLQASKLRNSQIIPITLAVFVALVLAFLAYTAFKKSGGS